MLEFLKRRLKSEKGAMDKILVTLLLVVVGVAAVVGLTSWMNTQQTKMTTSAVTAVDKVITAADAKN
jgi:predicted negative regulator of RcsB-dependent stress response